MADFWLSAMLMLIVAITIIALPLLIVRSNSALQEDDTNRRIRDLKSGEVEQDRRDGLIGEAEVEGALTDLDRELIRDSLPRKTQVQSNRRPVLAMLITIMISTLTLLLYGEIGRFDALEAEAGLVSEQTHVASNTTQDDLPSVADMTRKLERHVEKDGGTGEEWAMLGRAYKYMKRYPDAINAFASSMRVDGENVQMLLETAEVMALHNKQNFSAESRALVLRALEMSPDDVNALWFAGVAEYQTGNYRQSMAHLMRLNEAATIDEQLAESIRFYVQRARSALIEQGVEVASLDELLNTNVADSVDEPVKTGTRLVLKVSIDPALRSKVSGTDSVFVYAKAKSGPRMPLAVHRLSVAQLPATVVLDDSMAMVAGMNISSFKQLRTGARVSPSGNAISQSGDYIGETEVNVDQSQIDLTIVINRVVQ